MYAAIRTPTNILPKFPQNPNFCIASISSEAPEEAGMFAAIQTPTNKIPPNPGLCILHQQRRLRRRQVCTPLSGLPQTIFLRILTSVSSVSIAGSGGGRYVRRHPDSHKHPPKIPPNLDFCILRQQQRIRPEETGLHVNQLPDSMITCLNSAISGVCPRRQVCKPSSGLHFIL
jgi:hypothetical protein